MMNNLKETICSNVSSNVYSFIFCTLQLFFQFEECYPEPLILIGTPPVKGNPPPKKKSHPILIVIGVIIAIGIIGGIFGNSDDDNKVKDVTPKGNDSQVNQTPENQEASNNSSDEQFPVGHVIETKTLRISFLSAGECVSDNQFIQPKDGNVFYKMEFEFENIGDSDEWITAYNFDCYADGYATDQTYFLDDTLQATLSPCKKVKGSVCFEVPQNSQNILLEYETNVWTDDKIIFIAK